MKRLSLAKRQMVWDAVGYRPSAEQMAIHRSAAEWLLVAGGWSGGKSYFGAQEVMPHLLMPGEWKFHLVGKTYKEPRAEFEYILAGLEKFGGEMGMPGLVPKSEVSMPKDGAWRLRVAHPAKGGGLVLGASLDTVSAEDPLAIRAFTSDGAVLCEAAVLGVDVFEAILGRLVRTGGFLLLSGSFEGSLGWYVDYWTMGQGPNDMGLESYSLPSWSNLAKFPGGRQDPEIKKLEAAMSREKFLEKCAAIPCPPQGAVFKDYFRSNIHIRRDVEWVPGQPVYLAVDPGTQFAYAVNAIQIQDGQVRVFDGIYERDMVTDAIIDLVYDPMVHPWCQDIRYGVMDLAGLGRQGAQTPASETWRAKKGLVFTGNRVPINDGIEVMKTFLRPNPITGKPRVVFSPKCAGILSEFGAVVNPLDKKRHVYSWGVDHDGVPFGTVPENKWNDGIKALTYFLVDHFGYTGEQVSNQSSVILTQRSSKQYRRRFYGVPA